MRSLQTAPWMTWLFVAVNWNGEEKKLIALIWRFTYSCHKDNLMFSKSSYEYPQWICTCWPFTETVSVYSNMTMPLTLVFDFTETPFLSPQVTYKAACMFVWALDSQLLLWSIYRLSSPLLAPDMVIPLFPLFASSYALLSRWKWNSLVYSWMCFPISIEVWFLTC